ncbi:MAG: DNA-formamidopyrimidine glycosylase family protein, partial [Polyangiaceae bacterium]
MPELPDVELYIGAIAERVVLRPIERLRFASPFVLRTFTPPAAAFVGKKVEKLERIGKRIVFVCEGDLFIVIHLMIAGRFRWADEPSAKIPGKLGLAALDFPNGTLVLTEASSKKRASINLFQGRAALETVDPGGLEPLTATVTTFGERLRSENHTLKRSLTDPHLFSGIGNAYSDEILHAARMSPVKLSSKMTESEVKVLLDATKKTLTWWTKHLREETAGKFPEKVTAFRPEMKAHGKFGKPCPDCGTTIQRIRYASNETDYCPTCQTGGKLLADRSLSRLLKDDWPKTPEELEEHRAERRLPGAALMSPSPKRPAAKKAAKARGKEP